MARINAPNTYFNGLFHTKQSEQTALRIRPAARIMVIGDHKPDYPLVARDYASVINELEVDLLVSTGDLAVDDGDFASSVGGYFTRQVWPVPGNHDVADESLAAYEAYFTHLPTNGATDNRHSWMTSINDCVKLFGINSVADMDDDVVAGGDQALWLREQSVAATEPWQFCFFHYPPYTNSETHEPTTDMRWGHGIGDPFELMTAIISGHNHHYERLLVDHKNYIVNGAGANGTLYPFSGTTQSVCQLRERGFMLIDANWGSCTAYFINLDGQIRDQISFQR